MRIKLACATLALATAMATGSAFAVSGEITVWSWNVAAESLKSTIEGFNKQFPDVKVTVEDLGNQQVFDKSIAGCAAGGEGLPDVVSIENGEAEIYWSQFPDCFADLHTLGYTAEDQAKFPDFKRTELEVGDIAYAMPWDSGPVAMFYNRDLFAKAGVDPASIVTWDDYIAAGKKVAEANPGVVMGQADFNGDTEFLRMIANEQGCAYFSADGMSVTVNQTGCVGALAKIKDMKDAGTLTAADWGGKLTSSADGTAASQMFGGWYEGSLRSNDPAGAGKWGVMLMPSLTADGPRAANLGGSALSITSVSKNKEAAYAYVNYTLGTVEGQVTMLKKFGLVPSLLAALDDPYVAEAQPYWGGQAVWQDILATMPRVVPGRGTPFQGDAEAIVRAVQTKYFAGEYADAKAALDDAATQIASATGLPVAQ